MRKPAPLSSLKIGDRFCYQKDKDTRWIVCSKPQFNKAAGTATMQCRIDGTKELINKVASKEVIKLPIRL